MNAQLKFFIGGLATGFLCFAVDAIAGSLSGSSDFLELALVPFPGFIFGLLVAGLGAAGASVWKKAGFIVAEAAIYAFVAALYMLLVAYAVASGLSGGADNLIENSQIVLQGVVSAIGAAGTILSLRILGVATGFKQVGIAAAIGFMIGIIVPVSELEPVRIILYPLWQSLIAAYCGWMVAKMPQQDGMSNPVS